MALPNLKTFADLKKVVQAWINRKDQVTLDNIPMFINMAEQELYRILKLEDFIQTTLVSVSSTGQALAPPDVDRYVNLYLRKGRELKVLKRCSIADLSGDCKLGFAVTDDYLLFSNDINGRDQVYIEYYKEQPLLTNDTDTSVLLDIAPDLLVYSALTVASRWSNDTDEVGKWDGLRKEAILSLQADDDEKEFSGGALVIAQRHYVGV